MTEKVSSELSAQAKHRPWIFFAKKSEQLQPISLQNQTIETMHLPELGLSESESYCLRVRLHWTGKVKDAKNG